jgi:Tol biopolymer transport system component
VKSPARIKSHRTWLVVACAGLVALGLGAWLVLRSGGSAHGLYVVDTHGGKPKLVLRSGRERCCIDWSPDGRRIGSEGDIVSLDGVHHSVHAWKWSRDGSRIAYTTDAGLFVGPADWSSARFVAKDAEPLDWSADGKLLAFTDMFSETKSGGALYLVGKDGTGLSRVWRFVGNPQYQNPSWIEEAEWAPRGSRLAVKAVVDAHEHLYLFDAATSTVKRLPWNGQDFDFRWGAKGSRLVYGGTGITPSPDVTTTLHVPGGRPLTICRRCGLETVSPDSRRVTVSIGGEGGLREVPWVAGVDGTGLRRLLDLDSYHSASVDSWAPDGTRLAVSIDNLRNSSAALASVPASGGPPTKLTDGTHMDFGAKWSRDGRLIAFDRDDRELWVMNADGSGAHLVMKIGGCGLWAWSPVAALLAVTNAPCDEGSS